jgi:hypothetical protein
VHCNRLRPLYETILWTDEPMSNIIPAADPRERLRKHISTQTNFDVESSNEMIVQTTLQILNAQIQVLFLPPLYL